MSSVMNKLSKLLWINPINFNKRKNLISILLKLDSDLRREDVRVVNHGNMEPLFWTDLSSVRRH